MDWRLALAATAGGAVGSLGRYALTLVLLPISIALPWGTVLINVAGSFVIGAVAALAMPGSRWALPDMWRVFVMVGVCGGFTTFSAFSLQTFTLMREGAMGRAMVNVAVSVVLCVAATAAGDLAVRAAS